MRGMARVLVPIVILQSVLQSVLVAAVQEARRKVRHQAFTDRLARALHPLAAAVLFGGPTMKKRLLDWILCPNCGERPQLQVLQQERVEVPAPVKSPSCAF